MGPRRTSAHTAHGLTKNQCQHGSKENQWTCVKGNKCTLHTCQWRTSAHMTERTSAHMTRRTSANMTRRPSAQCTYDKQNHMLPCQKRTSAHMTKRTSAHGPRRASADEYSRELPVPMNGLNVLVCWRRTLPSGILRRKNQWKITLKTPWCLPWF